MCARLAEPFAREYPGQEQVEVSSDDKYLMLWAWKADKRSLKSWYIRGQAFQRVGGKSDFSDGVYPLVHRPTLPVAVLVRLHFLIPGVLVDGLLRTCIPADAGYTTN